MTIRRGIWLGLLLATIFVSTALGHQVKILLLNDGLFLPVVTADTHVTVAAAAVDFGTVLVGQPLTQTLTVTNVSAATQTVTIDVDPELLGVSVAPTDVSFSLAPGAAPRTVTLTYAPSTTGELLQGAVVVRAADVGLPEHVAVPVTGVSATSLIDLRDTACPFTADMFCRHFEIPEFLAADSTFFRPQYQVCNLVDESVTISRAWISPPAGIWNLFPSVSPFVLDPPIIGLERPCTNIFNEGGATPTGDRWNIATIPQSTLPPGTYQGTIGTTASLANGTTQTEEVGFLVTFVDSFLDVSASALDFGIVPVGTSATRTFTVTNHSIGGIHGEVSVPAGQGLSVSSAGGSGSLVFFNLPVGGTQTFELTYAPVVEATLSGSDVSVTAHNNWSSQESRQITLTGGTQVAPPVLVLYMPFTSPSASLSTLPYGQVIVNDSSPFEVYLQNLGGSPATSLSFRAGGQLIGVSGCVSTVCLEWKDGSLWRPLTSWPSLAEGARILSRLTWKPTVAGQAPPTPFLITAAETSWSFPVSGQAVSSLRPLVQLFDAESPERPLLRGLLLDGALRAGDETVSRRFVLKNLGAEMASPPPELLDLAPGSPCLPDAYLNKCFFAPDGEPLLRELAPGEEREIELVWTWSPAEQSDSAATVRFTNGRPLSDAKHQETTLEVTTKCAGCSGGGGSPGDPGNLVAYPDEFAGARGLINESSFLAGRDIDAVNTANGNLVVTLPIGTPLPVGPSFNYGLSLVHNSSLWQMRTLGTDYGVRHPLYADWVLMMPFPTSAGLGWNLSLGGELYADPYEIGTTMSDWPNRTGDYRWVYVDATGGSHPIGPKDTGTWAHAADGSMIRVRGSVPQNQVFVDLPSGLTQTFTRSAWACPERLKLGSEPYCYQLTRIEDPFGNWVVITYEGDSTNSPTATITDLHGRTIKVHYQRFDSPDLTTGDPTDQVAFPSSVDRYVDRIDFPATPTATGAPRTATWDFVTSERMLNRICPEDENRRFGPSINELKLSMPVLDAVVLPEASAGRFDFTYGDNNSNVTYAAQACKIGAGELTEIRTPSGSRLHYTYGPVATAVGCESAGENQKDAVAVRRGVRLREEVPADPNLLPKRSQRYVFVPEDRKFIPSGQTVTCTRPNTQVTHVVEWFGNLAENRRAGVSHFRHEIFFHNMTKSEHNPPTPVGNWKVRDDGLPISKNESLATTGSFGEKLFLSHLLLDCPTDGTGVDIFNPTSTGCTVERRTYRNYAYKTVPENCSSSSFRFLGCTTLARPLRTERTEAEGKWRETQYSSFDGYGHARRETTRSNFGGPQLDTWEHTQYFVPRGAQISEPTVSLDTSTMTLGTLPESDPAQRLADSDPWNLNLYRFKESNPDGAIRRTDFDFDNGGFLQCVQTYADLGLPLSAGTAPVSPQASDRDATVHYIDSPRDGRADWEETSGGEPHLGGGCSSSGTPEYRLRHTYSLGRLATTVAMDPSPARASATDVGPLLVDNTIDPATGLITQSCDHTVAPALCTKQTYDRVGRLTRDEPIGGESRGLRRVFTYTLENDADGGGNVRVETFDLGGGSPAPRVGDVRLSFDDFGREHKAERRVAMARKDPRVAGGTEAWIEQRKWHRGDDQVSIVTGVFDRDLWSAMSGSARRAARYHFRSYDIQRRLLDFESPRAGEWVKLSYSASGHETNRFEPFGTTSSEDTKTTTRSDHLGRPVLIEEGLRDAGVTARQTTFAYSQGKVTATRKLAGNTASQQRIQRFDGGGLLVEETLPEKTAPVTYRYDSGGNPTRVDDNGVVLLHSYDEAGRLTVTQQDRDPSSSTDPLRWLAGRAYDAQGRLASATRQNYYDEGTTGGYVGTGRTIDVAELWYGVMDDFRYDNLGHVNEKITRMVETRWTAPPGTAGAQASVSTLVQLRATWTYDSLGRVKETSYPECWSTTVAPAPGEIDHREQGFLCDGIPAANIPGWAGAGFPPMFTRHRYELGELVGTDVSDAATPAWKSLFDYTYHPSGNLSRLNRYDLRGQRVGYDERPEYAFQAADPGFCQQNNLGVNCKPELTLPRIGAILSYIEPVANPPLPNLTLATYQYNGRGQISSDGSTAFTYDHLRRLTRWLQSGSVRDYAYDEFDNLLTGDGDFVFTVSRTSNRLASVTPGGTPAYDGRGHLTGVGDLSTAYDPFGRQTAWWWKESAPPEDPATDYDYQSLYAYSAAGERVGLVNRLPTSLDGSDGVKVSDTQSGAGDDYTEILVTFHTPAGGPLREFRWTDQVNPAGTSSTANQLGLRSYVGREAVLIKGSDGSKDRGYELTHLTSDHLGNRRYTRTFDGTFGTLVAENLDHYLAYGMPDPQESFGLRIHERFGFAGHEHDRNGANYKLPRDANSFTTSMKARTYAQHFGRFLSPDPARDSSAWSLYAYAGNDPVNNIDPTGLSSQGGDERQSNQEQEEERQRELRERRSELRLQALRAEIRRRHGVHPNPVVVTETRTAVQDEDEDEHAESEHDGRLTVDDVKQFGPVGAYMCLLGCDDSLVKRGKDAGIGLFIAPFALVGGIVGDVSMLLPRLLSSEIDGKLQRQVRSLDENPNSYPQFYYSFPVTTMALEAPRTMLDHAFAPFGGAPH